MYRTSALLLAIAPLVPANPVSMAPRESSTGCSNSSLHNFEWQVEGFDFHASYIFSTPAHQNSWGYASFNLTNPAVPDVVTSCSASSNTVNDFFYGSPWYTCTASGTPDPAPASFAFNRPTGELKINQTWTCFDADPQYPTTFHASGSVNLTLACTNTTWQNPDWAIGEIDSDTEVTCDPVTVEVAPYLMTAVA